MPQIEVIITDVRFVTPLCPETQKAKTPRHQLLKFTDCARVVEAFSIHSHHF
jgi:hypothetical protein